MNPLDFINEETKGKSTEELVQVLGTALLEMNRKLKEVENTFFNYSLDYVNNYNNASTINDLPHYLTPKSLCIQITSGISRIQSSELGSILTEEEFWRQ